MSMTACRGRGWSNAAAVPAEYLKPWEFRFTRDEVLYDMTVASTLQGKLTRIATRLRDAFAWARQSRKWRTILAGKSAQAQLWGVPPPKGWRTAPVMREWARRTLEIAGSDPSVMLVEWEVFWRRKGF